MTRTRITTIALILLGLLLLAIAGGQDRAAAAVTPAGEPHQCFAIGHTIGATPQVVPCNFEGVRTPPAPEPAPTPEPAPQTVVVVVVNPPAQVRCCCRHHRHHRRHRGRNHRGFPGA